MSQEKWAALIFIFRQECTQFPILDTVIFHSKQWDLAPMWFLTRYHLKKQRNITVGICSSQPVAVVTLHSGQPLQTVAVCTLATTRPTTGFCCVVTQWLLCCCVVTHYRLLLCGHYTVVTHYTLLLCGHPLLLLCGHYTVVSHYTLLLCGNYAVVTHYRLW